MNRAVVSCFVVATALASTACSDGTDPRDPAAFCGRLRLAQSALTDPTDPAALVALYQDLDDEAPLQIKDDWHQITELLVEVTTYDPNDDASVQATVAHALTAQAAVNAVATWARDTCRIDLGPIPTLPPIGGTGDQLIETNTTFVPRSQQDATDDTVTDATDATDDTTG